MKRRNAPSVVLPLVSLTLALVVLAVVLESQQGAEAKGLRGKVGATMVRSSLGGRSRKRHAYSQKATYESPVPKRNANEDEGGPGGLYDWDGKLLKKVKRRNKKKTTTTAAPPESLEETPQVTTERGNRPGFKCCSPVRVELDSGFGVGAVSRPKV